METNAMRVKAAVFDFDFTLGDSSEGIFLCVHHALDALGLPRVPEEAVRRAIGLTLPETLPALAGAEYAHLAGEFTRHFTERADEVMVEMTHLYEFVPGLLATLQARGLQLGVVSTKYRYRIEGIFEKAGLADRFDTIVGGEDVALHKPDPEGLFMALRYLDAAPLDAVYVGDTVMDAETALRAGTPFIAVLTGVTPREAFLSYPARAILDSAAQLPDVVSA
jgi:phosphoglycolate phosphatase